MARDLSAHSPYMLRPRPEALAEIQWWDLLVTITPPFLEGRPDRIKVGYHVENPPISLCRTTSQGANDKEMDDTCRHHCAITFEVRC
jgi:hypothetical protein